MLTVLPPATISGSVKGYLHRERDILVNGKEVTKAYVDLLEPENIQTAHIVKEGNDDKVKIVTRGLIKLREKISYEDAKKLFVVDKKVQAVNFDISSIGKENIKTVKIIGDKNEIKNYSDEDYTCVIVETMKYCTNLHLGELNVNYLHPLMPNFYW